MSKVSLNSYSKSLVKSSSHLSFKKTILATTLTLVLTGLLSSCSSGGSNGNDYNGDNSSAPAVMSPQSHDQNQPKDSANSSKSNLEGSATTNPDHGGTAISDQPSDQPDHSGNTKPDATSSSPTTQTAPKPEAVQQKSNLPDNQLNYALGITPKTLNALTVASTDDSQNQRVIADLKDAHKLEFTDGFEMFTKAMNDIHPLLYLFAHEHPKPYNYKNVSDLIKDKTDQTINLGYGGRTFSLKAYGAGLKTGTNTPQYIATGFVFNVSPFLSSIPFAVAYPYYNGTESNFEREPNQILRTSYIVKNDNTTTRYYIDPRGLVLQYDDTFSWQPNNIKFLYSPVHASPFSRVLISGFLIKDEYNSNKAAGTHNDLNSNTATGLLASSIQQDHAEAKHTISYDNSQTSTELHVEKTKFNSNLHGAPIGVMNLGGFLLNAKHTNNGANSLATLSTFRSNMGLYTTNYKLVPALDFTSASGNLEKATRKIADAKGYYEQVFGTNNTTKAFGEGSNYSILTASIISSNALIPYYYPNFNDKSSDPNVQNTSTYLGFGGNAAILPTVVDKYGVTLPLVFSSAKNGKTTGTFNTYLGSQDSYFGIGVVNAGFSYPYYIAKDDDTTALSKTLENVDLSKSQVSTFSKELNKDRSSAVLESNFYDQDHAPQYLDTTLNPQNVNSKLSTERASIVKGNYAYDLGKTKPTGTVVNALVSRFQDALNTAYNLTADNKNSSDVYNADKKRLNTPLLVLSTGSYDPDNYLKFLEKQDDKFITSAATSNTAGFGVDEGTSAYHLVYDDKTTHKSVVTDKNNLSTAKPNNNYLSSLIFVTGAFYDLSHKYEKAQYTYKLQALQAKHDLTLQAAAKQASKDIPTVDETLPFADPKNATISALGSLQCGAIAEYCLTAPYNLDSNFSSDHAVKSYYGTAVATSIVSAISANVLQAFPWFSSQNLQTTLLSTATDLGVAGVDSTYGWGMVNYDRARLGPAQFIFRDFDADMTGRHAAQYTNGNSGKLEDDTVPYLSVFANDITGSHGLTLHGRDDSTLVLSGYNTYTGDTKVESGLLVVSPLKTPKYDIQTVLPYRFSNSNFRSDDNQATDGFTSQLDSKLIIGENGSAYLSQTHLRKDVVNKGRLFLDNTVHIDGKLTNEATGAKVATTSSTTHQLSGNPVPDTSTAPHYIYYQKLTDGKDYKNDFKVRIDGGIQTPNNTAVFIDLNWFLHSVNRSTINYNTPIVIFQTKGANSITGSFDVYVKINGSTYGKQLAKVFPDVQIEGGKHVSQLVIAMCQESYTNQFRYQGTQKRTVTDTCKPYDYFDDKQKTFVDYDLGDYSSDQPLVTAGGSSVVSLIERNDKLAQPLLARYFDSNGRDEQAYNQLLANNKTTGNILASLSPQELLPIAYSQSGTIYGDLQLATNAQTLATVNNFVANSTGFLPNPKSFNQPIYHAYANYTFSQTNWSRNQSALTGAQYSNGTSFGMYGEYKNVDFGLAGYYNNNRFNDKLTLNQVTNPLATASAATYGAVASLGLNTEKVYYSAGLFSSFNQYQLTRNINPTFGEVKGKFSAINSGLNLKLGNYSVNRTNLTVSEYIGLTLTHNYQTKFTENFVKAEAKDLAFTAKSRSVFNTYLNLGGQVIYHFNVFTRPAEFLVNLNLVNALSNQDFNLNLGNDSAQTTTVSAFSNQFLAQLKLGVKINLTKDFAIKLSGDYQHGTDWENKQANVDLTYKL